MKERKTTLCENCERSTGRCSWSAKFVPVDGWEATPSKVMGNSGYERSYVVTSCPKYEQSVRYEPKFGYKFRRGHKEWTFSDRKGAEQFVGKHIWNIKKAAEMGNKIRGYDVEMSPI